MSKFAATACCTAASISSRWCPSVAGVVDQMSSPHLVDRKSTRLNSSHLVISYAVFCLKKKIKDIRDEYNYPRKKGIKDECSRLLEASTMKSRRGFAIQRLMNAMRQAHADGWFIVFDTLTLADDRLEAF